MELSTEPAARATPPRRSQRELVLTLSASEYRLRFANSKLGFVWALAKPLLLFGILYVVFARALRFGAGIPNFPLMLLLGIVMWSAFAEITSNAVGVFVSRADLLRKVSIAPVTLVVATTVTALFVFAGNLLAVLVFSLVGGQRPELSWLWMIPLLVEMIVFAFGVSLCLATLFPKLRDVGMLWEVLLQMLFYATPVIYPLTLVAEDVRGWFLLNPLAQIFQQAREAMYGPSAGTYSDSVNGWERAVPLLIVAGVGLLGMWLYHRRWRSIVEDL